MVCLGIFVLMAWQASSFEREVLYDPFEVLGIDHVRAAGWMGRPSAFGALLGPSAASREPANTCPLPHSLAPPSPQGSTERQIKKKYRELSMLYHPDRNPDSEDTFVRIAKAYQAYVGVGHR